MKELENGISNKFVSEKYSVPKNTVSVCLKKLKKDFLVLEMPTANPKEKMHTVGCKDVDNAVFQWFFAERTQNVPSNEVLLKRKIMNFAKQLNQSDLKTSVCWLSK